MGQAKVSLTCGNCGTVNSVGHQFCQNCGYSLASGPIGPFNPTLSAQNAPTIVNPNPPTQPAVNLQQTSAAVTSSVPPVRRATGDLATGTLLNNRYRIVQLVGKGGFGAVYKAADERFQSRRVVAIKEMSDAQLTPAEKAKAIQDFRQEADLLVLLKHPNLPDVSDFFEETSKAYLVMEFIEGETLEKRQDDVRGPLPEGLVMGWALQLCDVLQYLHTQTPPVIFRDMKPSNVMVTKNGQIKLIDFGIARVFKSNSAKDTTSLGSNGYAPFEQYGGKQTDARSDMYALGATLYDLLTNTTPTDAVKRRVNPTVFERPRTINAKISSAAERIILKAMEEEPKKRFQSADEMARAIRASGVVKGASASSQSSTPVPLPPTLPVPMPTPAAPVGKGQGAGGRAIAQPPAPASPNIPANPPPTQGAVRPGGHRLSRRAVIATGIVGAAVLATAGIGGYLEITRSTPPTVTLDFFYSTEKAQWLQVAINAFQNSSAAKLPSGEIIQINGSNSGSVDMLSSIVNGEAKPVAWSPASALEINQLTTNWSAKYPGATPIISGELQPVSLVSSPLVFAVWNDRANVLLKHYGNIDWPSIHAALTLKGQNAWAQIGGQASWGVVTFGHTRPDQSNSGLLTITLMAYAYYSNSRTLKKPQIDDLGFINYLSDFESAVTAFGRSSGTFLQNVVIPEGPTAYDIIATYENLVLANQKLARQRSGQPWQMFYPGKTILSDHPFAILQGNWVSSKQQQAAQQVRDFLLSDDMQRLALANGFRPGTTNTIIHLDDPNVQGNPFRDSSLHLRTELAVQLDTNVHVQPPSGDVVNELIRVWQNNFGTAATANG